MKLLKLVGACAATLSLGIAPLVTSSQKAIAQPFDNWLTCSVFNIQSGQLAVRSEPAGEPFAGLNNGNVVKALVGSGKFIVAEGRVWYYVEIVRGPNSQVNGRSGWVNSDYLNCEPPDY